MRARGFRLVQLWVPDANAPGFRDLIARQLVALRASQDEQELDAWLERASGELALPPYDDCETDRPETAAA
jgi:hypothetical protein